MYYWQIYAPFISLLNMMTERHPAFKKNLPRRVVMEIMFRLNEYIIQCVFFLII